jgi:putative proteasome-type protease
MTYCIAIKLNTGLVMLSDSRTNAGVDHISTFRKMAVYEKPQDRVLVILSSGNLAISQAVKEHLSHTPDNDANPIKPTIWTARNLFEVAQLVGEAIRAVAARETEALKVAGVEFNINLLLGGQIAGEKTRLFHVYSAGNFIEATDENCYFQIGESKYGKPIIDRVVSPDTSLDEAAKCALISMDSTLKSNLSVGLPLDLLVYHEDSLAVTHVAHIDEKNDYFQMIRSSWGKRLKQVFSEIDAPVWLAKSESISAYKPIRDTNMPKSAQGMQLGIDNTPAMQQLTLSQ